MEKTKVKLNICGNEYVVTTDEDPKYVISIGDELDDTIGKILKDNNRLSITQAAILAALEYADTARKANDTADNLRGQIKEYLEDSARYKMEAEVARRDVDRLNRELQDAKKF